MNSDQIKNAINRAIDNLKSNMESLDFMDYSREIYQNDIDCLEEAKNIIDAYEII